MHQIQERVYKHNYSLPIKENLLDGVVKLSIQFSDLNTNLLEILKEK